MKYPLSFAVLLIVVVALSACASATPQIIEKEVVVEKPVIQTVIVEKEVQTEVEKKVVETVVVEKEVQVEKKVVETVIVEKIVEKEVAPAIEGLWYDPGDVGVSWVHICPSDPPQYGGTIVSIYSSGPPRGQQTWYDYDHDRYIFSSLIDQELAPDYSIYYAPDLAESWEASDDGMVYTFKLREDVTFHDGEPFGAEDVKFSYELVLHPELSFMQRRLAFRFLEGFDAYSNGEADEITGIKIIDPYTVQFTFTAWNYQTMPSFIYVPIQPKHVLEGLGPQELLNADQAVNNPIGTGPFRFEKVVPAQYYSVVAYQDYFNGRPYLDRIIFRLTAGGNLASASAWLAALEAGEIQIGGTITGQDRERAAANKDLVLVGGPMDSLWGYGYNLRKEYLQDKRVRQAMVYALDQPTTLGIVWGAEAIPFDHKQYDPQGNYFPADMPTYPYNPEKAKELLDEAGWDPDRVLTLITYYVRPTDLQTFQVWQQYWADVGVQVDIVPLPGPAHTERSTGDDWDLTYAGPLGIPPSWTNYACDAPLDTNRIGYCNPEVDELILAANTNPDDAERKELYNKAAMIMADELPATNLIQFARVIPATKNICNWRYYQYANWINWQPETWYLRVEQK